MRRKLFPLTVFAGLTVMHGAALAEIAVPVFPKTGKTLTDFTPAGWKVLKQAEGDLNKDSLPDLALILASNVEDTDSDDAMDAPRPLLLLLKQADGGFLLSAMHPSIVLCKMCGGVFGDPLEDLQIQRGAVVLKHYGGSNDRWGSTHRFRFQEGDWYLIGRTHMNHNSISGVHHEKDENLLTGDVVEADTDEKGRTVTKKIKSPKAPLPKMSQVRTES